MLLCSRCVRRSYVTSMNHVIHMNESCPTKEWVMSHVFVIHMYDMNESCHTYEWVMSHKRMSHVPHTRHSYVWHEWVTSYIWMNHVRHCVSWLIHMCVMAHSYVCHDILMNESCPTKECAMSHVWVMSYIWVDMIHFFVGHDSWFIFLWDMTHSCPTYEWVMTQRWMSHTMMCSRYSHQSDVMSYMWASLVLHMSESQPTRVNTHNTQTNLNKQKLGEP